ncbi:hypothetical protein CQA49_09805 [Helicobacter sp. MIT 00-7814]|uniref:hypothetical protein n=1 Tax=unclassified Helicobacter TaxID=2593540 RepID=UPI000E1F0AF9|nr:MULTISPECIES: hypothetical protein [unclassified Helicobacter]RDU51259.1 hypothetical protein CQA49_09805 [Helicobacter sp. MIT 00-7814]RDU51312.1 hypothetical protein CQA37_09795 [Helicobacter sp. MIT 99-10781]
MKIQLAPLFLIPFFISGCFTRIVKEPVYIPTKCEISMPLRPNFHSNTAQNVKDLLIYTQELENDLRFCINGEVF